MQAFEILVLLVTAIFFITQWKGRSKITRPLIGLMVLFLSLHLIIEGYRWQMIPGYSACLLVVLVYLLPGLNRILRYSIIVVGLLLVLTGSVLGYLIPIFEFKNPQGEFSVGLKTFYVEDTSRFDEISREKGDYRKLVLKVWYPSDEKVTSPQAYLNEGLNLAFANSLGMPPFIFAHLPGVETHIQENLSISEKDDFPVIVLSHGLGWNSELYTSLIEQLVSRGYIICGIEHTYENALSIYEGKRIPQNREVMDAMDNNLNFEKFNLLLEDFKAEKDLVAKLKKMQHMVDVLPYNNSFSRWSADISFALDELERLGKEDSFLYGKMDLNAVGFLGHSWGGAAAVQAAANDQRAKAVINMDGAQWGQVIDTTLATPLLSVLADRNYEEFFTPNKYIYDQITAQDYYEVLIRKTGHASFGDIPYWARIPELTDAGTIDPNRMTTVMTALIEDFFRKFTEKQDLDLIRIFDETNYPELVLEKKK